MKHVFRNRILVASATLFFSGCGKPAQVDSARNADELAVLAQSSFYQGELAPAADPVVQLTNGAMGDGGFIPGGGGNGNGSDTGTIPAPTPGQGGNQPPTGPGVTPPVTPNPDPGPIAQNPPVTPPTDPVVPPPPSANPTPNPGTDPVVPTPPGNDGGSIAGPTPPGANPPIDGGTVPTPPGNGGVPDGGTVTPPIAENPPTNPPTDPTTPTQPPVNPPTDPNGPIAQNPPTAPPVIPPTNPPANPPVTPPPGDGGVVQNPPGGNPPGDGGAVPPIPPVNPPGDGGSNCPGCPATNVTLYRACSRMRSEIPFPKFVFFEEADRPLLSLEATVELPATTHTVMAGIGNQPHPMESQLLNAFLNPSKKTRKTPVTLSRRELNDIDLMKGVFKTRLELAVAVAKAWYPKTWQQIYVKAAVCDDRDGDGMCQDEVAPYQLLAKDAAFKLGHIPKDLKLMVWNGRSKTLAGDPRECEVQYSPVVLDLAGNGFQFTSPSEGVWFDLNDTGEPLVTGWTAGNDDAFLVRDLNGNGNIDSGAELFGSATRLPNGSRAANGFKAMQALDSNQNGYLDRGDATWGELRLWIDRSHDGVASPAELFTLDRAQVTSINLSYLEVLEVDAHGNETRQRSVFRRTVQGRSIPRQVIDVWFTTLSAD